MSRKDFWGFTNGRTARFVRVVMRQLSGLRALVRELGSVNAGGAVCRACPGKLRLYEGNLDPLLRFIHVRDIQPAGWVRVPAGQYRVQRATTASESATARDGGEEDEEDDEDEEGGGGGGGDGEGDEDADESDGRKVDRLAARTQIDVVADWTAVTGVDGGDRISPMLVASVDIECSSSHGGFPVPRKDYPMLASELQGAYLPPSGTLCGLGDYVAREAVACCIMAAHGHDPPHIHSPAARAAAAAIGVSRVHAKSPLTGDALRAAAKAAADDVHLALKPKPHTVRGLVQDGDCQGRALAVLNALMAPWWPAAAAAAEARQKARFRQSGDPDGDPTPGVLDGDTTIHIGMTYHVYGRAGGVTSRVCLTLGSCDPIPVATVIPCTTERQLLLRWASLVRDRARDLYVIDVVRWTMHVRDLTPLQPLQPLHPRTILSGLKNGGERLVGVRAPSVLPTLETPPSPPAKRQKTDTAFVRIGNGDVAIPDGTRNLRTLLVTDLDVAYFSSHHGVRTMNERHPIDKFYTKTLDVSRVPVPVVRVPVTLLSISDPTVETILDVELDWDWEHADVAAVMARVPAVLLSSNDGITSPSHRSSTTR